MEATNLKDDGETYSCTPILFETCGSLGAKSFPSFIERAFERLPNPPGSRNVKRRTR
jgi:hypothetical protein